MEEAQHSKLDTLMVEGLAKGRSTQEIEAPVEEYLEIGGLIDGGLKQQVEFDLDAFIRATGRELNEEEKDQFRRAQLQANRWTYLGSAIYGASRAAEASGNREAARDYYIKLLKLAVNRDTERPELAHARRFLKR